MISCCAHVPDSIASYEVSRSRRCCGSMALASSSVTEKNCDDSQTRRLQKDYHKSLTGASKVPISPRMKCAPLKDICSNRIIRSRATKTWDNTYAALTLAIRMIEAVDVQTILGEFGPRSSPGFEHLPEAFRRVCLARESAAHADDGDFR